MTRFVIGIDLGTTNTCVCYVEPEKNLNVQNFPVLQLCAPGSLEPREQLPSLLFVPDPSQAADPAFATPWNSRAVVGTLAKSQGALAPDRLVTSAKSWLCHRGIDPHAAILPWGAAHEQKISPVAASAAILAHIKEAWNTTFKNQPDSDFLAQEVIVTVPASFDEMARDLTLAAAKQIGLNDVVLLEEPLAAFYAWLDASHGKTDLARGDNILVFDMGGGTTDFTLLTVAQDDNSFVRTAVGDHLLLGGDNIDLALAKLCETRLAESGKSLDTLSFQELLLAARDGKEQLLSDENLQSASVSVKGRSSKLIAAQKRTQITRDELLTLLFDGFFPEVKRDSVPQSKRGGYQEFGLPYVSDPAVTRHLAQFLAQHKVSSLAAVLFNGGAMTPAILRQRIQKQLHEFGLSPNLTREMLSPNPSLAVAHGAAVYGLVRRGLAKRISGGNPRSFYIGALAAKESGESPESVSPQPSSDVAICFAPMGLVEGQSVVLDHELSILTNRPVRFRWFSSTSRQDDLGTIVARPEEHLHELPPLVTVVRGKTNRAKQRTVVLSGRLTELGQLEVICIPKDRDESSPGVPDPKDLYRLRFDVRGAEGRGNRETLAPETALLIKEAGDAYVRDINILGTLKHFEEALGQKRDEWPLAVARAIFDDLVARTEEAKRNQNRETQWLSALGFCLRPGTGAPLDDWRIKQMWRIFNDGMVHDKSETVRVAWWVMWRRISAGLSAGQQDQLYDRLAGLFLPSNLQKKRMAERKPSPQEAGEMVRALAVLERLATSHKIKVGNECVRRISEASRNKQDPAVLWALGRIGTRAPFFDAQKVVPPDIAETWLSSVLAIDWPADSAPIVPVTLLARRTGDRIRDISSEMQNKVSGFLEKFPQGAKAVKLVNEFVPLDAREEKLAYGDSLPIGLVLQTSTGASDPAIAG